MSRVDIPVFTKGFSGASPTSSVEPERLVRARSAGKAGRLLAMRADRLLSMTIGAPHHDPETGRLPAIAGELRMIYAAMHLACAEAAGVGSEADQSSARRFLNMVAPGLLADLSSIVEHAEFQAAV